MAAQQHQSGIAGQLPDRYAWTKMKMVGMTGQEAKEKIATADPWSNIHIIPQNTLIQHDVRSNRVRIFVDALGKVYHLSKPSIWSFLKKICSFNMGSSRSEVAEKERLKWTQELHDLFEKSVNQLGGPDRATPKGILKAMGIPGLTIYHVKSHLQKYRISQFVPETPNKSKFERRNISEILPNFSATAGAQLNEALQMQVEVQKRLSDQLEVQRNLKVKIEAQGRFLTKIGEEYKNRLNINAKPSKSFSPISLPSLCEESESDNKEPAESDSDVEIYDIQYSKTFQNSKRPRGDQKDASPQRHKKFTSESCAQQRIKGSRTQCESPEFGFPWNAVVYCQSPLMPASNGSFS